ncbi:phosphatase PAP2 family protein [Alicyclobacillus dauci]|uniref:Phosphatase PAP2 family protein n=1 Tax=Alicyclobacillus dauci TaxID=1475485 RepID=A0ABY6Z0X8_9BACL|nr:phosphatase PAP2 family protein [Alicyclobacillus dauci]WAH35891.1 phosphatase PAP2 family protein [Alicyclobacillus dauci]
MHPHQKKKLLSSGLFIISFLITFALFVEKLELHRLLGFDTRIINVVQRKIDAPNTRLMKFFTFLGSPISISVLVMLVAMTFCRKGQIREATCMIIANAAGAGFNEGLKYIFRRQRPDIHRLVPAHGYSFPSGHSMGSVMFYGTLCYFICRQLTNGLLKILLCTASGLMIMITGVSRIYLGVHYPSDVVSGYAAAGAWLSASIKGFNAFLFKGPRYH